MDRAWAFATAIININTGENYTVNDVKKMDKKGLDEVADPPKTSKGDYDKGGVSELARRTGISRKAISEYLKLLDLEPEVQAAVQEKLSRGLSVRRVSSSQT